MNESLRAVSLLELFAGRGGLPRSERMQRWWEWEDTVHQKLADDTIFGAAGGVLAGAVLATLFIRGRRPLLGVGSVLVGGLIGAALGHYTSPAFGMLTNH